MTISIVIGIVLILLIQLIPYGRDHNNPPVVIEPNWDSQQTRMLAKRACFDCHSNETIWPWYSNIAPASWLIYYDAIEARRNFNFSEWQTAPLEEPDEIVEVINEGEMPPLRYFVFHSAARLTPSEKSQLINGLLVTLGR
ncbi:MAG: cytochrome C [Chloroflexi bacterium RBG_16_47_49]|nr:MAG: cytochrome C [Chloroflexi bacterium RBG_16_47_49]